MQSTHFTCALTLFKKCLQLYDKYQEFVVESEKEQLIAKLQEVEDWLYEDGEDETKGVYIAKLEELKKVSSFSLLLM